MEESDDKNIETIVFLAAEAHNGNFALINNYLLALSDVGIISNSIKAVPVSGKDSLHEAFYDERSIDSIFNDLRLPESIDELHSKTYLLFRTSVLDRPKLESLMPSLRNRYGIYGKFYQRKYLPEG